MFGYVRPLKSEMKIKEYELFRSAYCGLCHSLKKQCGYVARFVLNYDFVFMVMLLSDSACESFDKKRCTVSPVRGKLCCCGNDVFDSAAMRSVILSYWKLKDSISDEGFIKSIKPRLAAIALRRAYTKSRNILPEFDKVVGKNLSSLSAMEAERVSSLDKPADCFAAILAAIAGDEQDDIRRRVLSELFYHTGRAIYILDALDDLPKDCETGSYNPLIYRFGLTEGRLSDEDKQKVVTSIRHSINIMSSSFELLDKTAWSPVLENIIYLGMPEVLKLVSEGKWLKGKKEIPPQIGETP